MANLQLFFLDTETTWIGPEERIIQFWWIFWLLDQGSDVFHEERIIKQYMDTDHPINPKAYECHKIDRNMINIFKNRRQYLLEILSYIRRSDYIVWHNIKFDLNMLKQECRLEQIDFDRMKVKSFCTMQAWTEIVNWPWGKRPKLMELYKFLFGKEFENAHDAMWDITATKDIFMQLYRTNKIVLF